VIGWIWRWISNRVIAGVIILFVAVGVYEFRFKPQYKPIYEQGVADYRAGRYAAALTELQRAYEIAPNAVDVIMMMGWTELKLRHFEEARFYFDRVLRIDPRLEEARIGASFVAMETGKGELDARLLAKVLDRRSGDPNVRILIAAALVNEGKNFDAARLYRDLSGDRHYGNAARLALEQMYGMKGFTDKMAEELPPANRPAQLQFRYRADAGGFFEQQKGDAWAPFYIAGVNLGPAAPGYYPGSPPTDGDFYAAWIKQADNLSGNVLRAYTLLPPGFYRAYRHYVANGGKLKLFQQVWIGEPPNNDLYDHGFVEETRAEIRYVVDSIHGRGDVPPRRTRGSGIYDSDISGHVAAILFGREIEPSIAIRTNVINLGRSSYNGQYISISGATATEVWCAEMLDYLVRYETDTYNWQHPVAMVNWPPLDPIVHPTEAPTSEEVRFRIRRGEQLAAPKELEDDTDVVSIDEARFRVSPAFRAGLFASYHVYPFFPDFLLLDPKYLRARDSIGPNPVFGYLQELRGRIPYPLVITEFGLPNSIGISHFHPYGWHHGGQTEQDQAAALVHLWRGIRESGCAGGVVFELMDEWFKHNWLTVDFEKPLERANLWLNDLDPEKRFGLLGFHTSKWKLFAAADDAAWQAEQLLYTGSGNRADESGPRLRSLRFASDEGYLYLRLDVTCLECRGRAARGKTAGALADRAYVVAINTTPNLAGIRQLPFSRLDLKSGANFLLFLGSPTESRLLVADNYNPFALVPKPGVPGETALIYRRNYTPALQLAGSFGEFVVETNRRRFGRDGTAYPAHRYSRSVLRYGNPNPSAQDYDSLSEWYADAKRNLILVRIPWGKLVLTDPSSRQAFFGYDAEAHVRSILTPAIELSVYELANATTADKLSSARLVASYPPASGGVVQNVQRVGWKDWQAVAADPYVKKSYYAIQKEFSAVTGRAPAVENRGLRADRAAADGGGPPGR